MNNVVLTVVFKRYWQIDLGKWSKSAAIHHAAEKHFTPSTIFTHINWEK
jgi:hypothetical protein